MDSLVDSSNNKKNYSTINGNSDDEEVKPEESNSSGPMITKSSSPWGRFTERNQGLITTLILFVLAILNMSDRYIISSVLIEIQMYFKVSKSGAGLLQTIYLLSFMAFSPLSGYLGDRFNRKYILIVSILIWVSSIIGGSYVTGSQLILFGVTRVIFGFASALFETIGVPIIGDRFKDNPKVRSRAIVAYTVGPGLGTGIAYFISLVAKDIRPDPKDWQLSMRITPVFLLITLAAIIFAYIEPERSRNKNEMTSLLESPELDGAMAAPKKRSTFLKDLKLVFKNRTFFMLVICWTAGLATVGAVAWWSSTMIQYSLTFHNLPKARKDALKKVYSLQQAICGVTGLISPAFITSYYKKRGYENIDCTVLAIGFFLSSFFLYIYLVTLEVSAYLTMLISIPLTISFSLSWLSGFNIFLDVVPPSIRATALSIFFFVLHSIGDSVSPYWVGLIAEQCIKHENDNTFASLLNCTRLSYYPLVYLSFFAGAIGLFSSLSYSKDKQKALEFDQLSNDE